jgi:hypothetical protein
MTTKEEDIIATWAKVNQIGEDNLQILLREEFNTILAINKLTENQLKEMSIKMGARTKILSSLPVQAHLTTVQMQFNPSTTTTTTSTPKMARKNSGNIIK